MTLGEIKKWIEKQEKDYPGILNLETVFTIRKKTDDGPTIYKDINKIRVGFDWDSGKVFFEEK